MSCNNCTNGCERCSPVGFNFNVQNLFKNYDLRDPLPPELRDSDNVSNFFRKNKYIPHYGFFNESSQIIQRFVRLLTKMSPTLNACIDQITFNSFGGMLQVVSKSNQYFDLSKSNKPAEIGPDLENQFVEHLSEIDLSGLNWGNLPAISCDSYKSSGNSFLRVQVINTVGVSRRKLTYLEDENVLYKYDPNLFDNRVIHYSLSWSYKYLKENPPVEIPVYPQILTYPDGSIDTVIHIKNITSGCKYYGRPDWWACGYDAFLEIKNKEYLLKSAANNFTPGMIIEVSRGASSPALPNNEQAQNSGFKNEFYRWSYNYTDGSAAQGGEASRFILMAKASDTPKTEVTPIPQNTREKYFEIIDNLTSANILGVNKLSDKFLGWDRTSGLSGLTFTDELKKLLPLFCRYQNKIMNEQINEALNLMDMVIGEKRFLKLQLKSRSPYQTMIEEMDLNNQQKQDISNSDLNKEKTQIAN